MKNFNEKDVTRTIQHHKTFCKENVLDLSSNDCRIAYLEPIGETYTENDVDLLTKWRAANQIWFPSQFNVTKKGTENWLINQVIKNETKILYMIKNLENKSIGHIGLACFDFNTGSCDIDNVIKGEEDFSSNIMMLAEQEMINLAFSILGATSLRAQLFDDNLPSKLLHFSNGFKTDKKIAMKERVEDNGIFWDEIPEEELKSTPAERYFLHMILKSDSYFLGN